MLNFIKAKIIEKFFTFGDAWDILAIFFNQNYLIRKELFKNIKSLSKDLSGVLLDFGCGSKPYEKLILSWGGVVKYIGVDIEESGHTHENEKIDFFWDGKRLPFENSSFDSVLCSEVLEHVFEPDDTLQEIKRVLKDGGKILLTIPFFWEEHEIPYDYARYSSYGIKYLLDKNGFRIVKMQKCGNSVQVVFQIINCCLEKYILKIKNLFIRYVAIALFGMPLNVLGIIFSLVLPKNDRIYFNNIILAEKI